MDWGALITGIANVTTEITHAVNAEEDRKFQMNFLREEGLQQSNLSKEQLALLKEGSKARLDEQKAISRLYANNIIADTNAKLKNWINDPKLGMTCANVYDATGDLSPTCIKAGFNAENIELKREADRQRNYKIGILALIVVLGTVFFFANRNKK